ncbi:MAG: ABC transporter permease, partial [Bauldia sp.]|nr:ABC transporter permease [Bauldia sp.]
IVIAHRLSTVLGASKICVVEDGKITESGRHAELLAAGKRYARLYQLQFKDPDDDEEDEKVASVG